MKTIAIELSDRSYAEVKAYADRHGVTVEHLCLGAVHGYVADSGGSDMDPFMRGWCEEVKRKPVGAS